MKITLVVLFFLGFYLFFLGNPVSFLKLSSSSSKPPKTVTLIDLIFENDSDTILKGEKITQKRIEYELLKNYDYTNVEVICYFYSKEEDRKQKKLNLKRAKKVRDILIKTKLISLEKIRINSINSKPKKKNPLESYKIEIKLNFNESFDSTQNSLIVKDKTQTVVATIKPKKQLEKELYDTRDKTQTVIATIKPKKQLEKEFYDTKDKTQTVIATIKPKSQQKAKTEIVERKEKLDDLPSMIVVRKSPKTITKDFEKIENPKENSKEKLVKIDKKAKTINELIGLNEKKGAVAISNKPIVSEKSFLAENDNSGLRKEFKMMLKEKKSTNKKDLNTPNEVKSSVEKNTTKSKPISISLSLREADIIVVTVKNKSNKIVNKFSKEFDKSGVVNIAVPTDNLLPGKYKITMVGINGAFANAEIEKK